MKVTRPFRVDLPPYFWSVFPLWILPGIWAGPSAHPRVFMDLWGGKGEFCSSFLPNPGFLGIGDELSPGTGIKIS